MLYLWMPETNGTWYWSTGENWLQTNSLEQLIQDLHRHNGKEASRLFSKSKCSINAANYDEVYISKRKLVGRR